MTRAGTDRIRNETINIRVKPRQRDVIDRAARALGKSRSEFILDTACREAETVLLDRRFFTLDDTPWLGYQNSKPLLGFVTEPATVKPTIGGDVDGALGALRNNRNIRREDLQELPFPRKCHLAVPYDDSHRGSSFHPFSIVLSNQKYEASFPKGARALFRQSLDSLK